MAKMELPVIAKLLSPKIVGSRVTTNLLSQQKLIGLESWVANIRKSLWNEKQTKAQKPGLERAAADLGISESLEQMR